MPEKKAATTRINISAPENIINFMMTFKLFTKAGVTKRFACTSCGSFRKTNQLPAAPTNIIIEKTPRILCRCSLHVFFTPFPGFSHCKVVLTAISTSRTTARTARYSPTYCAIYNSPCYGKNFSRTSIPVFKKSRSFVKSSILMVPLSWDMPTAIKIHPVRQTHRIKKAKSSGAIPLFSQKR